MFFVDVDTLERPPVTTTNTMAITTTPVALTRSSTRPPLLHTTQTTNPTVVLARLQTAKDKRITVENEGNTEQPTEEPRILSTDLPTVSSLESTSANKMLNTTLPTRKTSILTPTLKLATVSSNIKSTMPFIASTTAPVKRSTSTLIMPPNVSTEISFTTAASTKFVSETAYAYESFELDGVGKSINTSVY